MDEKEYKIFLLNYMDLLELLLEKAKAESSEKFPDGKLISDLRMAERSFNFLLNYYPMDKPISDTFGLDEWNALKKRRDALASTLADMIESNEMIKKRFEGYCDNLKNPRQLGSML